MDDLRQRRRYLGEEEDDPDLREYQETHRRFSDRVERLVMQLVILGLVGLVLVQSLAISSPVRRIANLMEGEDGYALTQDSPDWGRLVGLTGDDTAEAEEPQVVPVGAAAKTTSITVVLMNAPSAPKARLMVGGRVVGTFAEGTVTSRVDPGQMVAVDGTATDEELVFRVVAAPGLSHPPLGHEVTTRGSRQNLGTTRRGN
ncbi:MAG TPA: hypothetical protein VD902_20700 [Symbiobacteriaceae bacterium]|nr:hypothetical protein [Symbiobacteriaceae bacterium]